MGKRLGTSIVLFIFLIGISVLASIEGKSQNVQEKYKWKELIPYEKELKRLNKEWGTDYKIQLEDEDREEVIEYFSSDRKIATVRFRCARYFGKGVVDNIYDTITCKFSAANTNGAIM